MPNESRLWARHGAAALCVLTGLASVAGAQEPLSAIDWLSRSVASPVKAVVPHHAEPRVSKSAMPAEVAVTPLDTASADAVGLLSPEVTGFPRALWGMGQTTEIANRIAVAPTGSLPALQALLTSILLAEAEAPADSADKGQLLLARVDKLLAMGALDPARRLLEAAGKTGPEIFRRQFDIALLTGTEDAACGVMQKSPDLAPTFPARIFCLARSGDWNAAALSLRTGQALGFVDDAQSDLLTRFLDPQIAEDEGGVAPPAHVTPLDWRLLEAIGEPLPTQTLPIAFARAELRETSGWKARLEAAERLARAGALEPPQLLRLYTERRAAASGGVWDRVREMQAIDRALTARDAAAVAKILPDLWLHMSESELEVPLASLIAPRLATMTLTGETAALAYRIRLLAPEVKAVPPRVMPVDPAGRFLVAVALGHAADGVPADDTGRQIAQAFRAPALSDETGRLVADARPGEALLQAIDEINRGFRGDPEGLSEGLSLLRELGLDEQARRISIELLLLERRG